MNLTKNIKFSLLLLATCCTSTIFAQFGNEWINYSHSYFKIAVWNNRLYQIPKAALQAAGISNTVQGNQFALYKNGVEIPMFISTNGILSNSDFIEFQGSKAKGELDKEVYTQPSFQVNPNMNLINDTAYYFLMVDNNTSAVHLRINVANNIISSPPPKENYCWDAIDTSFKEVFVKGVDYDPSNPLFESSRFEQAEGYTRRLVRNTSDSLIYTLGNAYKNADAPDIVTSSIIMGYARYAPHRVKIAINNNILADSTFSNYDTKKFQVNYPATSLAASNQFRYRLSSHDLNNDDNVGFSYLNIRYPRQFAFGSVSFKAFEIDAKSAPYYIEIAGFNTAGVAPLLYDFTNNKVYTGDISTASIVKYQLPASNSLTKFYIARNDTFGRVVLNNIEPMTFVDLASPGQQGNYIILYSKNLVANAPINYIEQYKQYRESALGGSYKVKMIDVEQLYNQFGFGYNFHIAGVRRFLKYAKQNWTSTAPDYLFMIGKGVEYNLYNTFNSQIAIRDFKSVLPTFGIPGSDIVMVDLDFNGVPDYNVGRLSVFNNLEIKSYLDKIKDYEARLISNGSQYIDSSSWKKGVLHIAGGDDLALQIHISNAFARQKPAIENKSYGGTVKTISKNSTNPIEIINSQEINDKINSGLGLIQYYGHSASTTFAFALNQASDYTNSNGKYNTIIANGCDANNYFLYSNTKSLTEDFITIPNTGSIAFIGSVNNGYPGFLDKYTDTLYSQFYAPIGNIPISKQIKNTIQKIVATSAPNDMMRPHTEQIQLHGDPAVYFSTYTLPDYAVEEKYMTTYPAELNSTLDSFKIICKAFNLAKHNSDSISMTIKRTFANNTSTTYTKTFAKGIAWMDSMEIKLPLDKINGKGLNVIEVKIDAANMVSETFESNNIFSKQIIIYDDDAVPVYPYNFSILHSTETNPTLIINTLNPLATSKQYIIQIDTTTNFNSTTLRTTKITSAGGVIEWKPNVTMQDSVVYYWRCAKDTLYGNKKLNWANSSFIYLLNGNDGWNQSHYHQYQQNNFNSLQLDQNRNFSYVDKISKIKIYTAKMFNPVPFNYSPFDYKGEANGDLLYTSGCAFNVMHMLVIDSVTGEPIANVETFSGSGIGKWGSKYCKRATNKFFEFNINNTAARNAIMDFIDSIPTGYYVAIYPFLGGAQIYAKHYAADTAASSNGPGVSLYHKLKNLGFTQIDSFNRNKPWIFYFRKGMGTSFNQEFMAADSTILLSPTFSIPFKEYSGSMQSTVIGPAKEWKQLLRKGYARDGLQTDNSEVNIYGIDTNGTEVLLASVAADTNISFINAAIYPSIRMQYNSADTKYRSAEQLHFWRVLFAPLPDLAIAPNIKFLFADKYSEGQNAPFELAIKNVSKYNMDSTDVKVYLQDANQNKVQTIVKRIAPLKAFDSTSVSLNFTTKSLEGNNSLFINLNPNRLPNENTFGNNFAYKLFDVTGDKINPNVDITFDGVRIMKEDIVSAKPFIKIKLKDENKYLRLDDTALIKCFITYPTLNAKTPIYFNNDSIKFIPASANNNTENVAYIEYTPFFGKDGIYELEVIANDKSGNSTGMFSSKVTFEVINAQTVSNIINYPNPFSTSTKFVFTLTGAKVPDNMKIQIMTISGKVVREITKPELGNVHIGKNITDYTWDGTDQFGDQLGNGVYFYRFITSDAGAKITNKGIFEVDKFIKKGMGKMVIMR
jgi:Peptidase family C25